MFKKILLGLLALIIAFVVFVALQPAEYHIERSIDIDAPADVVWEEFSNFANWEKWSHWAKMDPEQKTTVDGAPGTVGHKNTWDGEKTGKGSMTVTSATRPTALGIKLEFTEPMASVAATDFAVVDKGGSVSVTWSMDGDNGFMGKLFGLMMGGMDAMIGKAYEEGLASLKEVAEESAKAAAAAAAAEPTGGAADGDEGDAPAEGEGDAAAP